MEECRQKQPIYFRIGISPHISGDAKIWSRLKYSTVPSAYADRPPTDRAPGPQKIPE